MSLHMGLRTSQLYLAIGIANLRNLEASILKFSLQFLRQTIFGKQQ